MITQNPSSSPLVKHRKSYTDLKSSLDMKIPQNISSAQVKTLSIMGSEEVQAKKSFFSRYQVESPNFAHGSYGQISTAKDHQGKMVAIKAIPAKVNRKWIDNEVQAGIKLSGHKNIVNLREVLHTSGMNYLVFDYIKGAELFQFMESRNFQAIDEKTVKHLFSQMVDAISFAHSKGVAHRDLKLENIMVDKQFNLFIIDFGLSSIGSNSEGQPLSAEYVGSDSYMAPEIIKRTPYNPFKADVWSMGMILYAMLFGQFPWEDTWAATQNSQTFRLRFPRNIRVSDEAKTLLVNMLQISPSKRISVEDILKDEWLRRSDV